VPLIERKELLRLLKQLTVGAAGLKFNGHETGHAELISKHARQRGLEGASFPRQVKRALCPGQPRPMGKSKCLNRQEFGIVRWTDPEGSRPHLGALLLDY
jgi:ATP-dependent DNA ligase